MIKIYLSITFLEDEQFYITESKSLNSIQEILNNYKLINNNKNISISLCFYVNSISKVVYGLDHKISLVNYLLNISNTINYIFSFKNYKVDVGDLLLSKSDNYYGYGRLLSNEDIYPTLKLDTCVPIESGIFHYQRLIENYGESINIDDLYYKLNSVNTNVEVTIDNYIYELSKQLEYEYTN